MAEDREKKAKEKGEETPERKKGGGPKDPPCTCSDPLSSHDDDSGCSECGCVEFEEDRSAKEEE